MFKRSSSKPGHAPKKSQASKKGQASKQGLTAKQHQARHSSPKKDAGLRPGYRFEGLVRDLSSDGQAVVAHPDGRIFFVPGAWSGEAGLFEVTSLKGRMGFARMVSLTQQSPHRRVSPCPHHGFDADSCGGCPWLFVDYAQQLMNKQQQVAKHLQPLNDGLCIADIWASSDELGYRNRAQLKTDGKRLGYVAAGSRKIAEVKDCLILNDANRHTLQELRAQLPNASWKPERKKDWTTLDIDDEINVSHVTINQRRPFRQGNSAQNQRMREWLGDRVAKLNESSAVVELFAGSGNFTEALVAAGCHSVCAVDSFYPAIESLTQRSLPGVSGLCSDLGRSGSAADIQAQLSTAQILVLDPPREGLKNLDDYLALAPKLSTIFYISCNLATLYRDLQVARSHKFVLQEVQPLDLFPQTPHVEILTMLTR